MLNFQQYISLKNVHLGKNIRAVNNDFSNRFYTMKNLFSVYNIPTSITNMSHMHYACHNLIGNPICGSNVTNMSYAYAYCFNLTGSPVCGDKVTDMSYAYSRDKLNNPVCGSNVTNMNCTYYDCNNMFGSPVCGKKVIDMSGTYSRCWNLTGNPVCGPNVKYMDFAYSECHNITGNPVCGSKVVNMSYAYYMCTDITGNPVCGPDVVDMSGAYGDCYSLNGSPICGNKVKNMSSTYYRCYNLIGNPVCGNNVSDMDDTYYDCHKLNGTAIIGPKVVTALNTYYNCSNITNIISYAVEPPIISNKTFYNISSNVNIFVHAWAKDKYVLSWASYADYVNRLKNIEDVCVYPVKNQKALFNETKTITVKYLSNAEFQVNITSDNESIISISDISHDNENIYFTMTTHEIEGVSTVNITIVTEETSYTTSYDTFVYKVMPQDEYNIELIEGAEYGFNLNDDGYYESENIGVDESCAICKVKIISNGIYDLYLDCISSSEIWYDFGLLSNINTSLSLDAWEDGENVFKSFQGTETTDVQSVYYGTLPKGEHYICVKYFKDYSGSEGRDSLQFRVRFE